MSAELENTVAKCTTFVGTFLYMSPERFGGEPYSFPSDVWSFGLTVMECATGEYPYLRNGGRNYWELMDAIVKEDAPSLDKLDQVAGEDFSPHLSSFLQACLSKQPSQRSTAKQLIAHPWLAYHSQLALSPSPTDLLSESPAGWSAAHSPPSSLLPSAQSTPMLTPSTLPSLHPSNGSDPPPVLLPPPHLAAATTAAIAAGDQAAAHHASTAHSAHESGGGGGRAAAGVGRWEAAVKRRRLAAWLGGVRSCYVSVNQPGALSFQPAALGQAFASFFASCFAGSRRSVLWSLFRPDSHLLLRQSSHSPPPTPSFPAGARAGVVGVADAAAAAAREGRMDVEEVVERVVGREGIMERLLAAPYCVHLPPRAYADLYTPATPTDKEWLKVELVQWSSGEPPPSPSAAAGAGTGNGTGAGSTGGLGAGGLGSGRVVVVTAAMQLMPRGINGLSSAMGGLGASESDPHITSARPPTSTGGQGSGDRHEEVWLQWVLLPDLHRGCYTCLSLTLPA